MYQPHARMRYFKTGNICSPQAADKGCPAVFPAETDVGRTINHGALRILHKDFQLALRIDESDGVGYGEGDPEIARFIKGDAVGKAKFTQG